jgi:surfeit locus 1 family protein
MTGRALVIALVALIAAAACVRMGMWQLSRYRAKREHNAGVRAALASPAVPWDDPAAGAGDAPVRRVIARGAYDESRHLLLSDVWREDSAGVEVITALRLAGGRAVLVDRGWLPSPDAIHAEPARWAEPGERTVIGLPVAMPRAPRGVRGMAWEPLADSGRTLWSARALDLDSVRARWPYALEDHVLRALPDPGAGALPRRDAPLAQNEGMHLSYAVQWFLFAFFTLAGAVFVAQRERTRARGGARRG